MIGFARALVALLLLALSTIINPAAAQDASAPAERFAGEARIGSQPPLPIHLELHRSGDKVTGTISIPGARFELLATQATDSIAGRFEGPAGSGALTLLVSGEALTATFDFGGQPGAIKAERTAKDAETFFRPPEQKLDISAAQWLEDLDRLAEILTKEHGSPFHRISREDLEREVARIRAAIPGRDGVAIALEFRKLAALIGDGHTEVALPANRPRLPVEFYWFEDGLRVVAAPVAQQKLLGARLVAVNDMPVAEITERMRAFVAQGETEGFYRAGMPRLIADPDILGAAGIGTQPKFAFTFEAADGARETVEFPATTDAGAQVKLGGGAPLWRRNDGQGFWSERLADGSAYLNWRSYEGFADQSAALLKDLDANQPGRLIIDLRDNSGGDYTIGRAFIAEIQRRSWLNRRGVLYVLIGRKTFSAAMTNAVDFKLTTEATLVGEPAGAAPNNWQEVRRFHLPNSSLRVGVSTLYYEFLPGQPELRPDNVVLPEPGDWGAEQDAAVRFVLAQPVID